MESYLENTVNEKWEKGVEGGSHSQGNVMNKNVYL